MMNGNFENDWFNFKVLIDSKVMNDVTLIKQRNRATGIF